MQVLVLRTLPGACVPGRGACVRDTARVRVYQIQVLVLRILPGGCVPDTGACVTDTDRRVCTRYRCLCYGYWPARVYQIQVLVLRILPGACVPNTSQSLSPAYCPVRVLRVQVLVLRFCPARVNGMKGLLFHDQTAALKGCRWGPESELTSVSGVTVGHCRQ
ncbi:hypothetical protein NDU88_004521 [Pleurodeles waltl]|uniref:Secreted protein n=1 Tax=Pleurodeles waltl TaxID=8319 RepID=A0AAV7KYM5_PLEWA|nr:hypothetical protein NDU88_004521 [Pleurodeles waltl]